MNAQLNITMKIMARGSMSNIAEAAAANSKDRRGVMMG